MTHPISINEEFLYYIWRYRLYSNELKTISGDPVKIISTGLQNNDSGPDFFNAKIRIDKTIWAGNIEIHVKSSDWNKHNHHKDEAYDSVVLHVVWENDENIYRSDGQLIPAIELKNYTHKEILNKYTSYINSIRSVPCCASLGSLSKIDKIQWFDNLIVNRLEARTLIINNNIANSKGDLLEVYYQMLCKSFGYTANASTLEMLAISAPFKLIKRHSGNLTQLEAILYGQGGLLNRSTKDSYYRELQNEYKYLSSKYKLSGFSASNWKFMRMRPQAFPTIRISQLANLIFKCSGNLTEIFNSKDIEDAYLFLKVSASDFWNTHYRFELKSKYQPKKLGKATKDIVLINSVIPMMFVYGKLKNKPTLQDRAIIWLSQIKAEKNKITNLFSDYGINAENSLESQALIELYKNYCLKKKCLQCRFGHKFLSRNDLLTD